MTGIALYDENITLFRRLEIGLRRDIWNPELREDILQIMLELPLLKVWKNISQRYPEVTHRGRPFIADGSVLYVYQHKVAATGRVAFLVMKYMVTSTEGVRWIVGAPESEDFNVLRDGLNDQMMRDQKERLRLALEKACESYRV